MNNIEVTKHGLIEKSSGRKIISPLDKAVRGRRCVGFKCTHAQPQTSGLPLLKGLKILSIGAESIKVLGVQEHEY